MAKVNIKSEKITPFGGIYYASKAFYALSLDKVINSTLGVRSSTYNGYQWDEIMSAMIAAHPINLGGNFLILQKFYTFVP